MDLPKKGTVSKNVALQASVLWHTVGGGFTKRNLKRYQGVCANVTARMVADLEISRLRRMGVAYTDFAEVSLDVMVGSFRMDVAML